MASLVAAGADVDALHPGGDPVFKFAFMSPSDRVLSAVSRTVVADSDQEQTTIAGTAKHVPLFIANGVDSKVAGQEGGFPLHWLIAGTQATVQYQFFAGTVHTRGVSGFGPDSDIYARALQLLEAKADVNACDVNGDTPLHHALRHNLPDVALLLIENGAKVNVLNGQGQLPIHIACASACGGVEMVTKLLDLGNDKPLSKAVFTNARRGLSKKEKIVLEISQV